jgi:hypothetical protein
MICVSRTTYSTNGVPESYIAWQTGVNPAAKSNVNVFEFESLTIQERLANLLGAIRATAIQDDQLKVDSWMTACIQLEPM